MRLIDADAAADLLERTAEFYRNEGHDTFAMNLFSDAVMLRDPGCFPTVDAVEVVHAQWMEMPFSPGTTNVCSRCGGHFGMPHRKFKFCPYCGARMDAKEDARCE